MSRFCIGEAVIGLPQANDRYIVTREGWIGVVYGYHGGNILVEPISKTDPEVSNHFNVDPKYFEPYQVFPEDVPYSWDFVKSKTSKTSKYEKKR
jgi:hypothetical protein